MIGGRGFYLTAQALKAGDELDLVQLAQGRMFFDE